jgi:hypothetical protein
VGLQIGLGTYCARIDSARALLDRSASRREAIAGKVQASVTA